MRLRSEDEAPALRFMVIVGDGFGASLMRKYGWKEGTPLGTSGNGITQALTLGQKSDLKGIGCDSGAFEPWWNDVYDKTVAGIKVGNDLKMEAKMVRKQGRSPKRRKEATRRTASGKRQHRQHQAASGIDGDAGSRKTKSKKSR